MKNTKQKIMKERNQKGITLIALVVTIVVLLILAGITINMVFSNNGVIKQAQEARNVQENAQAKDQEAVENIMSQAEYIMATKYTITFNANGGTLASETQDITLVQGNTIGTLPGNPIRNGYTFKGWYTQSIGGTQVTSSTVPTGSMILYAQWEETASLITFYIRGSERHAWSNMTWYDWVNSDFNLDGATIDSPNSEVDWGDWCPFFSMYGTDKPTPNFNYEGLS